MLIHTSINGLEWMNKSPHINIPRLEMKSFGDGIMQNSKAAKDNTARANRRWFGTRDKGMASPEHHQKIEDVKADSKTWLHQMNIDRMDIQKSTTFYCWSHE